MTPEMLELVKELRKTTSALALDLPGSATHAHRLAAETVGKLDAMLLAHNPHHPMTPDPAPEPTPPFNYFVTIWTKEKCTLMVRADDEEQARVIGTAFYCERGTELSTNTVVDDGTYDRSETAEIVESESEKREWDYLVAKNYRVISAEDFPNGVPDY